MNDPNTSPKTPEGNKKPAPEEKDLLERLESRFNRHKNDKLMMWLKNTSGRYLLNKLRSRTS